MDSDLCQGSSSPDVANDSSDIDTIIERLSVDETSLLKVHGPEKQSLRKNPNSICNDSESSAEILSSELKNCTGECKERYRENKVKSASSKTNLQDGEKILQTSKVLKECGYLERRNNFSNKNDRSADGEMCQPSDRINGKNISCGISSEHNSGTVGGDGEENRDERSRCQQHELKSSSNEINRPDVIMSCDLTSNSVIKSKSECSDEENSQMKKKKKDCPGSRRNSALQSTCSEGSYSRRKHHKHHKHKKRKNDPSEPEDNPPINPKVNPIFLWVRQEDTRIVEVLCEDYDHRNRIRLTRTHLGWRAIPKTKRFAEAIIPKPVKTAPTEKELKPPIKPKRLKRKKKRRKVKKKKEPKSFSLDNPSIIKKCSVALNRDDLSKYKPANTDSADNESSNDETEDQPESNSPRPSETDYNQCRNKSPSLDLINFNDISKKPKILVKSNSCDFPTLTKTLNSLPRSVSLDLKLKRNISDFKVQNEVGDINESENPIKSPIKTDSVKSDDEVEKIVTEKLTESVQKSVDDSDVEYAANQNSSESVVVDMTKHDSDFNDADCDELGQLLRDIPDLEFVEEEELEEVDEEDWSAPTDLSLPKSSSESTRTKLSGDITPVVTVTSSVRPPEPLTAPLPEVTITPIPKPKVAHQQKSQNNFLENLLSSSNVKCENEKVFQNVEGRPVEFSQCEKKASKHCLEEELESEIKTKKLKVEEITLKNLLSKQEKKARKPMDLDACIQKLKAAEEECPKSRLQELLTGSVNSDPISQLKEVLSNPHLAVPDPLLVPRARLPALVASPASEIPRLLSMHLEKAVEETRFPPMTDSDILEVSLSNLQSLLSCTPEKFKGASTQDLANYQKSLETFLEWQRYQSELLEAQMKSSKSVAHGFPGDISDMAAATAFSQMLWLPYLNQFDFNANRDFMSFMNSMLASDYQTNSSNLNAPPQINISQVPQPSPFLTPTSPMDIESHLKTLAMWQEALAMQQNSQSARACNKVSSALSQADARKNSKVPNTHTPNVKKSNYGMGFQTPRGLTISTVPPKGDSTQQSNLGFDIYQDNHQNYQSDCHKKNRSGCFQQKSEHQKQMELHQKYEPEIQNQLRRMQQSYLNQNPELLRQCMWNEKSHSRKPGHPRSVSVKPLANLIDQNYSNDGKNSWDSFEEDWKSSEFTNQVASKLLQYNTHIQKTRVRDEKPIEWQSSGPKLSVRKPNSAETKTSSTEVPKLKVKNLVDPSMSPPKLLKQIAPEHLPLVINDRESAPNDGQANLWHPLFGSNQIKPPSYNSPWRWTTVTVNGE